MIQLFYVAHHYVNYLLFYSYLRVTVYSVAPFSQGKSKLLMRRQMYFIIISFIVVIECLFALQSTYISNFWIKCETQFSWTHSLNKQKEYLQKLQAQKQFPTEQMRCHSVGLRCRRVPQSYDSLLGLFLQDTHYRFDYKEQNLYDFYYQQQYFKVFVWEDRMSFKNSCMD